MILFLAFAFMKIQAQVVYCPPNIDFESNNFSNWYLYIGSCCPINTPTLSGPVATRHTITNVASIDMYGGFPVVDPSKGLYSLKLGNRQTSAQAERARYYLRVPNNLNNYSLLLKYAVVLENPSHQPKEQPRFEVKAYDSITNIPISCAQFSFVASSVLPGFILSSLYPNVYYKPWSTASLNLSGYAGRTVAVDFASGDCSLGLHFGYGYVDVNCVLFAISSSVCKGVPFSSLSAPPGFQHYKWYDSTYTVLLDTNQNVMVPTPATFNKYHVVLSAYPGYGCDDTLSTTIYTSDLKLKINKDTFICKNNSVQLMDTATASARFQPLTFSWSPTNNLSCSTCLNPIASPTVSTRYALTVVDGNSCSVKDSFTIFIRRDSIITQPQNITKCRGSSATFKMSVGGHGNYTYQWKKNGVNIPGAILDSLVLNNIAYSDSGNYSVNVKWGCDSLLSNPGKLSVYPMPVISVQPQPISPCLASNAVLRVTAGGISPLSYQWKKNGINITGATSDSLKFATISASDSGYYKVSVSSICDSILSDSVFLTVKYPTAILVQPQSTIKCLNSSYTFHVIASGGTPLNYQWKRNGVTLIGQTKDSIVIASINYADTGSYTAVVSGLCGIVTSNNANLALYSIPVIVTQPVSILHCKGNRAVFKVGGFGINTYQWFKNNIPIVGANLDSLEIPASGYTDTGNYSVWVKGNCDSLLSNVVTLSFFPKPLIILQPQPVSPCLGIKASFRVSATSINPLNFQWKKNGINISGTADSLIFSSVSLSDTGYYAVMVKNACDSVLSDSVFLSVRQIPVILVQSQSTVRCLGDTFAFKISYAGVAPLSFQWKKNGTVISGATLDSLIIRNVSYADSGNYSVAVTGPCGTINSGLAQLNINAPPVINIQLVSLLLCNGSRAVFKVGGFGINTYQWFKNNVPIVGANLDSLEIPVVYDGDTGNYFVRVKGNCDSTNSISVSLNNYPKPVISLQPSSVNACFGTSASLKIIASGTGPISYQWIKNGIPVSGANKDSLLFSNIAYPDSGYYKVMVISVCDSLLSDSVFINVKQKTGIVNNPQSTYRCFGDNFSFSVFAIGAIPLTYQWMKNGAIITGANSDSLYFNNTIYSDTGAYSVIVNGPCGTDTSTAAILNLNVPLGIPVQPNPILQCKGSFGVFRLVGIGMNTYQWYKNNLPIIGEINDSLVFSSLSFMDTGNYYVIGKGPCDSLASLTVTLNLFPPTQITLQPQAVVPCMGSKAVFKASAIGMNTLLYQWIKNGQIITGATSDSLIINSSGITDTGYYYLTVKSACDSIITDSVPLAINALTSILGSGQNINKCIDDTFGLKVNVVGTSPIFYQWKKDGFAITNATSDSLLILPVAYADTGNYFVMVSTPCGVTNSNTTHLGVITPTSITSQPVDILQCIGGKGIFRLSGIAINSYQWFKNNTQILGEIFDSLVLNNLLASDTGNYYAYVSGNCNNAESNMVHVGFYPVPQANMPDTSIICANNNVLGLNGFIQYFWSTGSNSNSISIGKDGKYWVIFTDSNYCNNSDTTYVKLKSDALVYAGPDTILCNELALQLDAIASNYDSIRWLDNSNGIFSNKYSLTPLFTVNKGIIGATRLTLNAVNQCGVSSDDKVVDYRPKTSAHFSPTDTLICEGAPLIGLIPDNPGGIFKGPYVAGSYFDPGVYGNYTITYQIDQYGCSDSSKRTIEVLRIPVAAFTFHPALPTIDFPVIFKSNSLYAKNFLWDFGSGNSSILENPEFLFPVEGLYRVVLMAINSVCIDTLSVDILINGSEYIWVPNAFSPNGDGNNDIFNVIYRNSKGGVLSIYNRWGQLMYKTDDFTKGWDGTYNGSLCLGGVYFYIVDYKDNENNWRILQGNVTLLN